MAELAFMNGVRLHKDAILLYKAGSSLSAYQLSILAQEEIGKSSLLEEHVWQMQGHPQDISHELEDMMIKAMSSHKIKQGWFSRYADDYFKYRNKRLSKFIREVESGKLEENKQNATYVGLTKQNKTMNPNGKIVNPLNRIKPDDAKRHITRVNDYIVNLIEGCRRGVYSVDTEEVDYCLTMNLAKELELLWSLKSRDTQISLRKIRKFEIVIEE